MQSWIDELAGALEVEPLSQEEAGRLLALARDVAHRTERKITPLAAFLAGEAVGRAAGGERGRGAALEPVLSRIEASLPPGEPVSDAP